MTGLLASPRVLRGALVVIDSADPRPRVIAFQYNPDEMTRTLQARAASDTGATTGGARNEAVRLNGAAIENISMAVEVDATDQLERGEPTAASLGVYPQLSALEMLLYPPSRTVVANAALAAAGTIEVVPPEAPLTLLVWGDKRVVPVRLTQFSVAEQAFDTALNPIRAKVTLGLRVLSYSDLPMANPGASIFLAHQIAKEVMASNAPAPAGVVAPFPRG